MISHRIVVLSLQSANIVALKYRLIRPVVCFCKADEKVLTIPAGESLTLAPAGAAIGVCEAYWNHRPVFVFREDVEQNALGSS